MRPRAWTKNELVLIPLVLAGYARYLKGIDDSGKAFEPSPDPLLEELQAIVAPPWRSRRANKRSELPEEAIQL